jgi:hypothetical protein
MTNPVSAIKNKTIVLTLMAMLNAIVIFVMQSFTSSLKPYSIIGFEFAGSPEKAHLMVNTWTARGVLDTVYFLTGFDYLFMVTYGTFLWLACMLVSHGFSGKISKVFIVLAWLQPIAVLLDALENLALYQIISGSWKSIWPTLAAACAAPKFIIVLLAVLACLAGSVYKALYNKKSYSNIG